MCHRRLQQRFKPVHGDRLRLIHRHIVAAVTIQSQRAGVGRVLDRIDASGLRDRTVVIFYSDNGAFMLEGRGREVASNKPLRDGGVTLWEGGVRVPCIVRWPGRIKAGSVCREPLLSCDFFTMALTQRVPRHMHITQK